jgi:two-component system, cell cycle sensor histidine kinase and response regulator CckA
MEHWMQNSLTIQRKMTTLVVLIVFVVSMAVLLMHQWEQAKIDLVQRHSRRDKELLLDRLIALNGQMQEGLTNDYSRWNEMASFTSTGDTLWARVNLQPVLQSFRVSAIWVLSKSGHVVYTATMSGDSIQLPDSSIERDVRIALVQRPFAHFFEILSCGLVEFRTAPIQPTADTMRLSIPSGYFVVGRLWDSSYLTVLGSAIGGPIAVSDRRAETRPSGQPLAPPLSIERELPGTEGSTNAVTIRCSPALPLYAEMSRTLPKETAILLLSGMLLLIVVVSCLHFWVTNPLKQLSYSLATKDIVPLEDLSHQTTEFGAIARLVISQQGQQKAIELKQAEIETRKQRYERVLESVLEGVGLVDTNEIVTFCNPAFAEIFEVAGPDDMIGQSILDFIPAHAHAQIASESKRRRQGMSSRYEMEIVTKRGSRRVLYCAITPSYDSDGTVSGALATMLDITDRHRTEDKLRESHELLHAILDSIPVRVFWKDRNLVYLGCNFPFARDAGFEKPEDVIGKDDNAMVWRDRAELYRADDRAVMESEKAKLLYEEMQTTPSGEQICLLTSKLPLRNAGGAVVGVLGTYYEISERRRAEDALRESEARTRAITDSANDAILMMDSEGRISYWNPAATHILGYSNDEAIGQNLHELIAPSRFLSAHLACFPNFRESGRGEAVGKTLDLSARRKDGNEIPCQLSLSSVRLSGSWHAVGILRDLSLRRELEEQQQLLSAAIESAAEVVVVTDTDGRIEYANQAFEAVTGYSRADAVGKNASINKSGKHDQKFYGQLWDTILSGQTWKGQLKNRKSDGSIYDEEATISPVIDRDGHIAHFVAVKRNVTEELLLKQQLLQAQKAEALGVLAGGIAHDFNNMLTAIIGFASLLQTKVLDHSTVVSHASEIERTGTRAAELTRQLLAYSRKQSVRSTHVDVNSLIVIAKGMLGRVIGENLELVLELDSSVGTVYADSSQMEQVILNLVVNARDAMPTGGKIVLSTTRLDVQAGNPASLSGLKVGPHIVVKCIDTGTGISPDVIDRVFEPFFTTKELGKGTGLGLSTVYGIVKGIGGHVAVESELGTGSCFTVLIPESEADAHARKEKAQTTSGIPVVS